MIIWSNDGTSGDWDRKTLNKFDDVVWHVSWSTTGNILAVSGGDNKVSHRILFSFNIAEVNGENTKAKWNDFLQSWE